MRYQWIVRVLANPLIACDAVMLPFAREVLGRAQAEAGPGERIDLILDQSRASERHQILMLALRWGERALPLAWRVEETTGAIGFGVQKRLLDVVAAWLPEEARVRLLGDRFYGTPALIAHCQSLGWDYRLRLKGNLRLWLDGADAGSVEQLSRRTPYLTGVDLTARRVRTNVGMIEDPGHEEPWIVEPRGSPDIATSEAPGYLTTLDYARRWGIDIDQSWCLSRIKRWVVWTGGAAFRVKPDCRGNPIVAEQRVSTPFECECTSEVPTCALIAGNSSRDGLQLRIAGDGGRCARLSGRLLSRDRRRQASPGRRSCPDRLQLGDRGGIGGHQLGKAAAGRNRAAA